MDDSRLRPLLPNNEDEDPPPVAENSRAPFYDWLGRPPPWPHSKSSLGGRKTLHFTLASICLWYTAYFGVFFNMVLFFRNVVGEGSGAAANDTNNWLGTMFLSSLLGSFVAESFLGRLWTCAVFQFIAFLGMALMTLATGVLVSGAASTSTPNLAFFYISFYLVSIGCGGFQPNLQSLGADQFDAEGEKAAFFTRYLVLNNLGIALGDTVIVYVVTAKGWAFGFSMCTAVGFMGLASFLCGFPVFRQHKNKGNSYARALQVIVAAARKRHLELPSDSSSLYREEEGEEKGHGSGLHVNHTNAFRWLDKAAVLEKHGIREDDMEEHTISDRPVRNGWKLSSVTEVEELKAVLRLVPVWAASIFFNTIYSQAGTLMVEEGEKMDTSFWGFTMEPATMNMFNILLVVFLPPFYDAAIVPLARRFTGTPRGITPLYRTAVGYVLSIFSLSLAAILEAVRLQHVNGGLSPPSIFWQVPQFMLLGCAQFLAGIGQLEFFYTYAPPSLRSLGSAFCLTCIALGDYVSSILVTIVTFATNRGGAAGWIASADLDDGHLDYFFWLMAGLAFLNFLLYLACARSFTKQRSQVEGRVP